MKKIISSLLLLLLFVFNVQSQTARIGYVDTEYILDLMPEYRSAQKQLDLMSEEWQKELEKKFSEIEKMEKEFQAEQILLTEELKKKREICNNE